MIYIGEHALSKDEMIKHFQATINDVNSTYCEINVNGLLLVYDSYFVHIVEVSLKYKYYSMGGFKTLLLSLSCFFNKITLDV